MKPNNYKTIGITGGIATGKSTVTNIIKKTGYIVIDADKIARDVVEKNKPAYMELVDFFGEDILAKDRNIDRKKLGSIIFGDESLRKKLNEIVHPYVFQSIREEISKYGEMEKLIFLDIPLLIEELDNFKKHKIYFDEIWLVYIDKKTELNRLMKRDSIDENKALDKINSQISIEMKKEYVNRILDNRGNIKDLEEQIDKILKEII